ncbi:hypothetical protein [Paraflavitalea speifideaquila]|uniref:hypothetical protein n=1 Tax=Paraflavitalea speifideaquila TaxID=3076558 RepID=UPI0028E9692F|nr:hypothetical protein [Paraflavitalea speifideiaquila]
MEIEVQRKVKDTISIKTPSYYKYMPGGFSCITEEGKVINVSKRGLTVWSPEDGDFWRSSVEELFTPMYSPATKEEFEAAYQASILQITGAHDSILLTA